MNMKLKMSEKAKKELTKNELIHEINILSQNNQYLIRKIESIKNRNKTKKRIGSDSAVFDHNNKCYNDITIFDYIQDPYIDK